MDLVMGIMNAEILIYTITIIFCVIVVALYLFFGKKKSNLVVQKIELAKIEGRFEPNSLHPYIDLKTCIGSGACIKACPEKDIIGIVDGVAMVVNATSCIGHGACFHACPVEAISLRIGTEQRGVELPHIDQNYETNVKGIYIAGELGGMGLIKNSVEQGKQAVNYIIKSGKPKIDGVLDLVIIGAGPAGISGALEAKKNGLSFVTLEQDTLGGTVFTFPRAKIVMTNPMELPLYGKVKLFDTSKKELLDIWNDALTKNNIQITENTKVEKIIPQENFTFKVITLDGKEFICNHVLIAIGRRGSPRKLNIEGEDLPNVAYRLLEPELILNKKIVVVGGGDSAIESALLLMDQNEVILSYRKDQFARLKPKNTERILAAQNEKKINILFNSELTAVRLDEVQFKFENKEAETTYKNDMVFIFAGGELPTGFLKNAGIEISKRFGQIVKKH
jgi:thioredoxin reductase (NADPH)